MSAPNPDPKPEGDGSDASDVVTSPDGLLRIEYQVRPMRMSHEVWNPRITHIPSGQVLADYWGSLIDGQYRHFDERGGLHMHLREYPGSTPGDDVVYDPHTRRCYGSEEEYKNATTPEPPRPDAAAAQPAPPPPQQIPLTPPTSPSPPREPGPARFSVGTVEMVVPARDERSSDASPVSRRQVIPWLVLLLLLAFLAVLSWVGGMTAVGIGVFVVAIAFVLIFRNYKGN